MDRGKKVIALREVLRERFPAAHRPVGERSGSSLVGGTGVPCLDSAGVGAGMVVEVAGIDGGGLVVWGLLEGAQACGRHVALVDAADCFDPQDAGETACQGLLWVRCGGKNRVKEALRATDLLLRDGNIPLVLLDLQLCGHRELARIPGSTWFRLRGLVERGGGLLVALTPSAQVGCADLRVSLDYHARVTDGDHLRKELLHPTTLQGYLTRHRGDSHGTVEGAEGAVPYQKPA
ncbi:hypothetical protein BH23VER1_BH23VER1_34230 [soil metagenome]